MGKTIPISISIFVLLLLCFSTATGQNYEKIDSLQLLLSKVTKDEVKVDILLKISKAEELRDPEKSLKYAQQALQVAKQADFFPT